MTARWRDRHAARFAVRAGTLVANAVSLVQLERARDKGTLAGQHDTGRMRSSSGWPRGRLQEVLLGHHMGIDVGFVSVAIGHLLQIRALLLIACLVHVLLYCGKRQSTFCRDLALRVTAVELH